VDATDHEFTRKYLKMKDEEFDEKVTGVFLRDTQKKNFLAILDKQVTLIVEEGRPSPSLFFDSLNEIMPLEQVSELRCKFGSEAVSHAPEV
jgi:hypothetical protein